MNVENVIFVEEYILTFVLNKDAWSLSNVTA